MVTAAPTANHSSRTAGHRRWGWCRTRGISSAPLAAALIIVPLGQASLSWFALAPIIAMLLAIWIAGQHARVRSAFHAAVLHG